MVQLPTPHWKRIHDLSHWVLALDRHIEQPARTRGRLDSMENASQTSVAKAGAANLVTDIWIVYSMLFLGALLSSSKTQGKAK
jgi:hypothetical protein